MPILALGPTKAKLALGHPNKAMLSAQEIQLLSVLHCLLQNILTKVPRPPHWGGYLVKPQKIEFWLRVKQSFTRSVFISDK